MAKCEWIGGIMWPAFAVGVEVLRRRDIVAPDCQDLYCRGVVPVMIEKIFVGKACMCLFLVICVCRMWLSGGCQVAVRWLSGVGIGEV
jgi:hypothetical protein